jgi:hypothetical protein
MAGSARSQFHAHGETEVRVFSGPPSHDHSVDPSLQQEIEDLVVRSIVDVPLAIPGSEQGGVHTS